MGLNLTYVSYVFFSWFLHHQITSKHVYFFVARNLLVLLVKTQIFTNILQKHYISFSWAAADWMRCTPNQGGGSSFKQVEIQNEMGTTKQEVFSDKQFTPSRIHIGYMTLVYSKQSS